jgi:hypothetical protein
MADDESRDLGIIVEGARRQLLELYQAIESRPGIRITSWQDGQRGCLEIRTRRRP